MEKAKPCVTDEKLLNEISGRAVESVWEVVT